MAWNWIEEEARLCRKRNFNTKILTRDEVLAFSQFKRQIGFSNDWLVNQFNGNIEEANAYFWHIPVDECTVREDVLERLEWSGAIFKTDNGWHLTAKGRKMHAKLAHEGKFPKKKSRSKPVRTGKNEKKSKGPKTIEFA